MDTAEIIAKFERNHAAIVKLHDDATKAADAQSKAIDARLTEIEQKVVRRGGASQPASGKSWGETITEAAEFKSLVEHGGRGRARIEIDTKTVNVITSGSTLGGPLVTPDYRPDMAVALPQRRLTIRGLLAPGETSGNVVYYPRMTARQNNAAVVAELAQKPRSDFSMEQATAPVRTIAHLLDVSRQAFDDAPALRSLIDAEMTYGLNLTEEGELLSGDGSGEHILGLLPQASAYSAAFSITGETAVDRLALALLQAEQALLPATGIVLNYTDWWKIRLLKDGIGRYIVGDPQGNTQPMLWGLPVVPTPAITAGTFLVGSFFYGAQIFDRMAIEILISSENVNNFELNKLTIRCEKRTALAVKRPTAFITGSLP